MLRLLIGRSDGGIGTTPVTMAPRNAGAKMAAHGDCIKETTE
jgi:hypothetical protein